MGVTRDEFGSRAAARLPVLPVRRRVVQAHQRRAVTVHPVVLRHTRQVIGDAGLDDDSRRPGPDVEGELAALGAHGRRHDDRRRAVGLRVAHLDAISELDERGPPDDVTNDELEVVEARLDVAPGNALALPDAVGRGPRYQRRL